jgi:CheY-like chemotaxis protein
MSATDSSAPAGSSKPGPAILIVDDEAAARRLLKKVVQGLYPSARFHEALDGEVALQIARSAHPDLVLLDVVLPGSDLSGVLLCREFTRARIPVIVVSGKAAGPVLDACLSLGAAGILRKPFTVEEAQAKIKGCLG